MSRLPLVALLAVLVLAGCGGGSDGSSSSQVPVVAIGGAETVKAEGVCSAMIADAHRMGREFRGRGQGDYPSALAMTTEALFVPAIPVLEGSSSRLRALDPNSEDPHFRAYVNIFDPIVALLRERVQAGRADNAARAHQIELQLIELSALQRSLARRAGLKSCDVDFIEAFTTPGLSQ
jgi:hypothetical protein